jgi:hypothetical protein
MSNQTAADEVRATVTESLKQARAATENYFQAIEKGLASSPLPLAEQTRMFREYLQQTVTNSLDHSNKLVLAKDIQEIVRIQSEFFQNQLGSLTSQAKTFGENAVRAASGMFKMPGSG